MIRSSDPALRRIFLSAYRCHDCSARFWVVSANTYYFVAAIATVTLVAAVAHYAVWQDPKTLAHPNGQTVREAEALAETIRRADKNDPAAEYALAQRHYWGLGAGDAEEARKWLTRAATHGHPAAQYEYGFALRKGEGVLQDPIAATKWIMLSAEGGYAPAQFELGLMYRSGMGVAQNDARAYTWLNLAAAAGVIGAAQARDSILSKLSPAQLERAQAEARAYVEAQSKQSPKASH